MDLLKQLSQDCIQCHITAGAIFYSLAILATKQVVCCLWLDVADNDFPQTQHCCHGDHGMVYTGALSCKRTNTLSCMQEDGTIISCFSIMVFLQITSILQVPCGGVKVTTICGY